MTPFASLESSKETFLGSLFPHAHHSCNGSSVTKGMDKEDQQRRTASYQHMPCVLLSEKSAGSLCSCRHTAVHVPHTSCAALTAVPYYDFRSKGVLASTVVDEPQHRQASEGLKQGALFHLPSNLSDHPNALPTDHKCRSICSDRAADDFSHSSRRDYYKVASSDVSKYVMCGNSVTTYDYNALLSDARSSSSTSSSPLLHYTVPSSPQCSSASSENNAFFPTVSCWKREAEMQLPL